MTPSEPMSGHRRLVGILAVVTLSVGLILAVWLSRSLVSLPRSPMASEMIQFADGYVVDCTLRNNRGFLRLDLKYRVGGSISTWIGNESELGVDDPKLWYDRSTDLVHARIGRGKREFNRFGEQVRFDKEE